MAEHPNQNNLDYGKPNAAIFNIFILIQFNPYSFNLIFIYIQCNPRSFNSISIVILFNPYLFNSIFRPIQFNFVNMIQFSFCIQSIQFVYPFNSICNSFDSIRLYSFNLRTHLFNLGVWVKGGNLSGELGLRGEEFL